MEARQSSVEEMLEAQSETMDELRQQQEEVMRQVVLAEHKPAWDDALRIVVDVAFDFGSSLPEVSEVGPDAYGYSLSTRGYPLDAYAAQAPLLPDVSNAATRRLLTAACDLTPVWPYIPTSSNPPPWPGGPRAAARGRLTHI